MLQQSKDYVKNIQRFSFPESRHRPFTQVAGTSAIHWKRRETVHWARTNAAYWNQEARMYRRHLPFHSIVLLYPHPSWSRSLRLSPARKTKQESWKCLTQGPSFAPRKRSPFSHSISLQFQGTFPPSVFWRGPLMRWHWDWAVVLVLVHSIFLAPSIASSHLHLLKRIICYWCLLRASARCDGAAFA